MATGRTGDLTAPLRVSPVQERELLSRMSRSGVIVRVRRGLYLLPPRLPTGGLWSPTEAQAIGTLIGDRGGRWQFCGPNAFNRYGYDDQVPNRCYLYNNRISGERTVGGVAMTLIKVADERLGDAVGVQTPEGGTLWYPSRARTLVDAIYDWSRFGSLPRAYAWVRGDLASGRVSAGELARMTLRYGDIGTVRRMGFLLEQSGADERVLKRLAHALRPSESFIPWAPDRPKRGALVRRWGVVANVEGEAT